MEPKSKNLPPLLDLLEKVRATISEKDISAVPWQDIEQLELHAKQADPGSDLWVCLCVVAGLAGTMFTPVGDKDAAERFRNRRIEWTAEVIKKIDEAVKHATPVNYATTLNVRMPH